MRVLLTGSSGYVGAVARGRARSAGPRRGRSRHRPLRGLRPRLRVTPRAGPAAGRARRRRGAPGRVRRGRPSRRAVERPDRRARRGPDVRDQPRGDRSARRARPCPRCRAVRVRLVLQHVRGRRIGRCPSTRARRSLRSPRTPSPRCAASGRSAALATRRLLAGVAAVRDRLRRLAAAAARHRAQQPRRVGADDGRGAPAERRHGLAPADPRRGHGPRDRRGARGPARAHPRRGLQRGRLRTRTTSSATSRSSSPTRSETSRSSSPRARARTPAATGSTSRRSPRRCQGFQPGWDAPRGARQLVDAYRAAGMDEAMFSGDRFIRLSRLKTLIERGPARRRAAVADAGRGPFVPERTAWST